MAKKLCSFVNCCNVPEISIGFNGFVKEYCVKHAKEVIAFHIETLKKEDGRDFFKDECPQCGCQFLINDNGIV